jgi:winged helix-turn helix protein
METFTMSRKEVPRAGLVKAGVAGKITNAEGARALGLSVRQFRRLKTRWRTGGARSLVHRLRGRTGNRRLTAAVRDQITILMTTTYLGFNDSHLTEKLREVHALAVSRSSVRTVRRALGRPAQRPRAAPQHRSRRPRRAALGQLAQLDASPFAWFEDRGPLATLHGLIDDATSIPLALWFRPNEDLHGYVTVLHHTCRQYGVPVELYGDRLNLFQRNDAHWTLAEELQGQQAPTHFGRMLGTLGIGFIQAHSPQAKGRIERLWGTLQDRLTSELRLRGVDTLEAGNAFLPAFLADFIPRFAHPPATIIPAWRPVPRDLDHVLSCRYERTVGRDNTVQLGPRWVQIPRGRGGRSYSGCHVDVRELLDGRLLVFYQHVLLAQQRSPVPAFVLKPREAPGATRRRARGSPNPLPPMPASDPSAQALRGEGRRDRPGGRGLSPSPTREHSLAPRPPRQRRPSPTHPWRTPWPMTSPVLVTALTD